jgi:hypothetical protein
MKTVQRFCAAAILMLALTFSAFAGDILLPGDTPPPPPNASVIVDTSGALVNDALAISNVAELDPMTDIALSLLRSLLSFF